MTITRDAWLAELDALSLAWTDPDGMTVDEMHQSTGHSTALLRRMVGAAIRAGKWERLIAYGRLFGGDKRKC